MNLNKNYTRLFVLIIFSVFIFTKIAPAQNNLQEGIIAVKNGNYLKALELLKPAVNTDKTYEGYYYYGYALLKTGSLAEAEKYEKLAIDKDNERPEGLSALGEIYSAQKKFNDAENSFEDARKYIPLNKAKSDLEPQEIALIVEVLSREAENFIAEGTPDKIDKAISSLSLAKTYENNNPLL
jgi:tetratricopeptide (TPR) repeat protein